MQTEPERYSNGVVQAAKDIIAVEGLGFLLAGLGKIFAIVNFDNVKDIYII